LFSYSIVRFRYAANEISDEVKEGRAPAATGADTDGGLRWRREQTAIAIRTAMRIRYDADANTDSECRGEACLDDTDTGIDSDVDADTDSDTDTIRTWTRHG